MPAQGSYMGACAGLKSAPCTTQVFNAKGQEVPLAVLFVSPPLPHSLHPGAAMPEQEPLMLASLPFTGEWMVTEISLLRTLCL